jgi:uncharacterized protein
MNSPGRRTLLRPQPAQKRVWLLSSVALWLTACTGLFSLSVPEFTSALPTLASTAVPIVLTPTLQPASSHRSLPPATQMIASPTLAPTYVAELPLVPSPIVWPTALPELLSPTAILPLLVTETPRPADNLQAGLTIAELATRSYGGGELQIVRTLAQMEKFNRYLITYPSDGLTLYGFMNVPHQGDRFPVALVLHGYMPVDSYETLTYTTRYADALAEAGFFVIHPSFRNHPPSDEGPNPFRIGYAIDVLNLVALVQEHGSSTIGPLRRADAERIHLLGHSMGGGIALRVITVNPAIRSAVLYASMSSDERRNFEYILRWSGGERGHEELATPPELLRHISPVYFLNRIQTAVAIHHGSADEMTPLSWSQELCGQLQALGKRVECYIYPGAPHTFRGDADRLFLQRAIEFMRRH